MLSLARHFFHLFAKTLIEVLHVILMKEKWWNTQATHFTAIGPVRALKKAIDNDLPFNQNYKSTTENLPSLGSISSDRIQVPKINKT